MKQIAFACASLLFCAVSLAAADLPGWTPQPASSEAAVCSTTTSVQAIGIPKPTPKGYLMPPCIAQTQCSDGSTISCPVSYSYSCSWSDGCWVNCNDDGIIYCPGAEGNPNCSVW